MTLLFALGTAGCGGSGDSTEATTTTTTTTTTTSAAPTRYVITMKVAPAGSNRIAVTGQTNLPDGAVINISAGQAFRFRREQDIRASLVTPSRTVTVTDGAFSTSLGPLDFGDITVGLERGVGDMTYGPVVVVDNAVTVCAQFQTGDDFDGNNRQPDSAVRETIGPNGEALENSPQKDVFGSATPNPSNWLELVRRVSVGVPKAAAAIAAAQGQRPTPTRLKGFCL